MPLPGPSIYKASHLAFWSFPGSRTASGNIRKHTFPHNAHPLCPTKGSLPILPAQAGQFQQMGSSCHIYIPYLYTVFTVHLASTPASSPQDIPQPSTLQLQLVSPCCAHGTSSKPPRKQQPLTDSLIGPRSHPLPLTPLHWGPILSKTRSQDLESPREQASSRKTYPLWTAAFPGWGPGLLSGEADCSHHCPYCLRV